MVPQWRYASAGVSFAYVAHENEAFCNLHKIGNINDLYV